MPIVINNQPSAAAYGNAAYAAGAENLRRYEQAQALQQQELAQRAALTREGYANQRTMQGQQLDYNSRAAALGILADQQSRTQQYAQQQTLQDQQLQSAAQLQDQRLQYGSAELQAQLASRAALQEQSLGAQFARQYLQGQQQYGLNQQQFMNNAALSQQSYLQNLDFTQYKLDAQAQAQLNQIRQSRARLEQMKLNGQINDVQYQSADAQIKAKELGLSKTLPMQQNTDLVTQLNNSLAQHSETGAWMQQNPTTGMWETVDTQQGGEMNKLNYEKEKFNINLPLEKAKLSAKLLNDSRNTERPYTPEQAARIADMMLSGQQGPDAGNYLQQERQMLGMSQTGGGSSNQGPSIPKGTTFTPVGSDGRPIRVSPNDGIPRISTTQELASLPPGSLFVWKNNTVASQKAGIPDNAAVHQNLPGSIPSPDQMIDQRIPDRNPTSRFERNQQTILRKTGLENVGVKFPNDIPFDTSNVPTWRQYFGF